MPKSSGEFHEDDCGAEAMEVEALMEHSLGVQQAVITYGKAHKLNKGQLLNILVYVTESLRRSILKSKQG